MRLLRIVSFLASSLALMQVAASSPGQKAQESNSGNPPVLRTEEPEGDVIVRLPGPAPSPLPATPEPVAHAAKAVPGEASKAPANETAPSAAATAGLAALSTRQTAM